MIKNIDNNLLPQLAEILPTPSNIVLSTRFENESAEGHCLPGGCSPGTCKSKFT